MPIKKEYKRDPKEVGLIDLGRNYIPPASTGFIVSGKDHSGNDWKWETAAKHLDIDVKELIRFNYGTTLPEVVNFYLERNCGCTAVTPDERNYRFPGADPGVIYFPNMLRVIRFTPHVNPMALRVDPANADRYRIEGKFIINLEFNRKLPDVEYYEYRQLIRGGGFFQTGRWINRGYASERWEVTGPPVPIPPEDFKIPGCPGLTTAPGLPLFVGRANRGLRHAWKEDGHESATGVIRHPGHRPVDIAEAGLILDRYFNDGYEYVYTDAPNYGNTIDSLEEGLRVVLEMDFKGLVVKFDGLDGTPGRKIIEEVEERKWRLRFDQKIRSLSPLRAS